MVKRFRGMLECRTFHITWVGPGRGVGDGGSAAPDAVVRYVGVNIIVERP